MAPFLFRCPATGLAVQGWRVDEPVETSKDGYESVSCLACQRIHLVNPSTGEVLKAEEK